MAKLERKFYGDFDDVLEYIYNGVLDGSISADLEDESDYKSGDFRCAVRVFEKYSAFGGNRMSLSVTLIGKGNDLFVSAITSGGSQAVFFKINTVGENCFLADFEDILDDYITSNRQ